MTQYLALARFTLDDFPLRWFNNQALAEEYCQKFFMSSDVIVYEGVVDIDRVSELLSLDYSLELCKTITLITYHDGEPIDSKSWFRPKETKK